ncbi:hypothetical protein SAMN06265337_0618 [Hymenobacter gelipurpurascens]|uniref:Uncharacterized protein n=1 Tax=Hymenobacter gelipurpurascens TaxID=89968 RepID=A0A212T8N8_9BACT|nr:hypothetical protein [Hymenobacter gelipurpurascens]SNC62176.1 hypothetical protein SAMN06265337_0618 [Hymenobacter gelipurpurascens]
MTVNLPPVSEPLLHTGLWALGILLLWFWLRKELTPRVFLSIFETDGVLSARQILAWVLAIYGMAMRAAGRLDNDGLDVCLQASFILFGIGGFVKAAAVVKPSTTVNARKIDAKIDTENMTMNGSASADEANVPPAPKAY